MKRTVAVILMIALVMTVLTGCQGNNSFDNATKIVETDGIKLNDIESGKIDSVVKESKEDNLSETKQLNIVATIFPQYDFTRQIVGDHATITMLLSPGAETHSYEPTPQDIIKIQECDVFIYVGGESDEWIKEILDSMDTSNMKIITLMNIVEAVEEEVKEGMTEIAGHSEEEEVEGGGEEVEYDEHVWTSPKNAIAIVNSISKTLCDVDTANADVYAANTKKYVEELTNLNTDFQEVVDNAQHKTIVFGDRFPLRYFADEYGLDYWAAFPGCSTETEPSAATIAFLIDKVEEEHIPVIFQIEFSNGNIARTIAESTDAKVVTFYSCHNVTKNDFESGATYLSLMGLNVAALKEALN